MKLRIKEVMVEKGVSSIYLAKSLNVSKQTISNIINGRTMPSIDTLEKAADVLGVPIWQFFDDPKKIVERLPSEATLTEDKRLEIKFTCPECGEQMILGLEYDGTLDVKK